MKNNRILIIIGILVCLASTTTQAFTVSVCNNNATIAWREPLSPPQTYQWVVMTYYNDRSPTGGTQHTAMVNALNRVNHNPGKITFSLVNGGNMPFILGANNRNEIIIAPTVTNAFAQKWVECSTGKLLEADIFANSNAFIATAAANQLRGHGGSGRSMESMLIHELGHVTGFWHTGDQYNIMGDAQRHSHTNGNNVQYYVGEDLSTGLAALYGKGTQNRQDVSATTWKWAGTSSPSNTPSGAYSDHERTKLYEQGTDIELDFVLQRPTGGSEFEKIYLVDPGQRIDAAFTLENNGEDFQRVFQNYMLSNDNFISAADRTLHFKLVGLNRDSVLNWKEGIYIPDDVIPGKQYWLGVMLDIDNRLTEIREDNNSASLRIQVRSGGGVDPCITADNLVHIAEGRAYSCNLYYACATGSNDSLGFGFVWFSQPSAVKETSPGYWESVGSCP